MVKADPFLPFLVLGSHPRYSCIIAAVAFSAPTHTCKHTHANVMGSMPIRSQPLCHTAFMCFLLAALYSYTLESPTALGWGLCTAGSYSRWPNKWAKAGRHHEKKKKRQKKPNTPCVHRSCMGTDKKNKHPVVLSTHPKGLGNIV